MNPKSELLYMAETGYIALIIALPTAAFSAVASVVGTRLGSRRLVASAQGSILAVFALFTLALVIILYAFITKDFSIKIVAEHASHDLPGVYALSALYAGKAGSMFLWGWLVSLFTAVLVLRERGNHQPIMPYALAILAIIEIFLIAMITLVINVFEKHPSPPAEGFGLNPLLQNFGMLVHPPLLYLGFAGFAVVFALVMASLITRSSGIEWSARVRGWTIFAWCTLGIGNLVGMWWSYNELGWGGYWAWDPVENAGLMPWLLGTAFLHSIAMLRQRNYLNRWSLCLITFTFAFTLLSPFITHGGIESPLHGFYGSPLPPYILAAILVTLISSLVLLYTRRRGLKREQRPVSLISREGAFLLTNIILAVLVAVIFAGTVLPRVVEALAGIKLALDRSFFDRTCGPIMLILVFLMGVCPLLGWSKTAWHSIRRNFLYTFMATIVIAIVILVSGIGNWYALAVIICGCPLFTICLEWYRGVRGRRRARKENFIRAFFSLLNSNRGRYGGFLSHIGVILIALGIIVSSFYGIEKTETLNIGESMSIGDYRLTYDELVLKQDNVKVSAVASISVNRNSHRAGIMHPSYDYWFGYKDHFAEVAVRTTPAEDLFTSLVWTGYDPEDKSATFRVLVNPMIVWIWVGGGFFLLGGVVAFSAREKQLSGVEE
jgi:cytochrome c-type biogenesis protein CcmF